MKWFSALSTVLIITAILISGCGGEGITTINPLSQNTSPPDTPTIIPPVIPTATPATGTLSSELYVYKLAGSKVSQNNTGLLVSDDPVNEPDYEPVNGAAIKLGKTIVKTDSMGKAEITRIEEGERQVIVDPSGSANANYYNPIVHNIQVCDPNATVEKFIPDTMKIVPVKITVPSGHKHQFKCNFKQDNKEVVAPDDIVWTVEGAIGTVYAGLFTATAPGTGKVIATWGNLSSDSEVRVIKDTNDTGAVHGFVRYETQEPVSNAVIQIDGISEVGITDPDGGYSLSGIPEDTYTACLLINNITVRQKQIVVEKGVTAEVNFIVPQITEETKVSFNKTDYTLSQYSPTEIKEEGTFTLPQGKTAKLLLFYRVINPENYTDLTTHYNMDIVSGSNTFSIKGQWPGIRPYDTLAEIQFGADLFDLVTGEPLTENGARLRIYWDLSVSPAPTLMPADTVHPTPIIKVSPGKTPTIRTGGEKWQVIVK